MRQCRFECECENGWTGEQCEINEMCEYEPCLHGSTCQQEPHKFRFDKSVIIRTGSENCGPLSKNCWPVTCFLAKNQLMQKKQV